LAAKEKLADVVDAYLTHCQALGLEQSTVRAYKQALHTMLTDVGNIEVARLEPRHLDEVFARRNWCVATRNSRLAQYKGFFSWCRARGYMRRDSDPALGWRNARVPEHDWLRVPASEWPRLFSACRHPTETIVVATGLYLFLRASEQKKIQLKHVHLAQAEIDIWRVKNKQFDTMPITSELDGYIRQHLTFMAEQGWADPNHYLVTSRMKMAKDERGRIVGGTGVFDASRPASAPHTIVQRVLGRAGYSTFKEGEHTLRRSGARAYFDSLVGQGYDGALRRVQAMLGHEHARTTERYLGLTLDRQTRNNDLKGKPMFPAVQDAKVVPIRKEM